MSAPQPPRRRRIAGESKPGTSQPRSNQPESDQPQSGGASGPARIRRPARPVGPKRPVTTGQIERPSIGEVRPSVDDAADHASAPGRLTGWLRGLSPRRTAAVVVAAVVLGAGIGTSIWGIDRFRDERATSDSAAESAAAAAATSTQKIFTYQYDQLDTYQEDAAALLTRSYAKEFAKVSPALNDLATQRKAAVQALVQAAAPVPCSKDCTDDEVKVLVFLDQARLTEGATEPVVFGNRVVVTMVRNKGTWLVDDIRAL